jgi:hypothetical protein
MFLVAGVSAFFLRQPVPPQLLLGGLVTALGVGLYSVKPQSVRAACFGGNGGRMFGFGMFRPLGRWSDADDGGGGSGDRNESRGRGGREGNAGIGGVGGGGSRGAGKGGSGGGEAMPSRHGGRRNGGEMAAAGGHWPRGDSPMGGVTSSADLLQDLRNASA